MSEGSADQIKDRLDAACDRPIWGASRGIGSMISFSLGDQLSQAGRGEFHVWLYQTSWRWETPEEVIAGSGDSGELLDEVMAELNGLVLTKITVEAPSMSARFYFDDDSRLATFTDHSQHSVHWRMFLPGGDVFVAGPGAEWTVRPASRSEDR